MSRQFRVQKDLTKTPLAGNATYKSNGDVAQMVEQYNHVRGLVSSDQGGTLAILQSDDNVSFVTTNTITVTGGTPSKFDEICYANYVKLLYTNGATIQTSFYLSFNADPFK
jgi:hypothetical protein